MTLTKSVIWESIQVFFKDQSNGNKNTWTDVEHTFVKLIIDDEDGTAKTRDNTIHYDRTNITNLSGKIPNWLYNDLINH